MHDIFPSPVTDSTLLIPDAVGSAFITANTSLFYTVDAFFELAVAAAYPAFTLVSVVGNDEGASCLPGRNAL